MRHNLLCLALLAAFAGGVRATAQAPAGMTRQQMDTARMKALQATGSHVDGRRVSFWYPSDSLDPARVAGLMPELDSIVDAVDHLVGGPYAWQAYRHPRVSIYVTPERFVAHTVAGPSIFMPLWRVRGDSAPWIHESAHAILTTARPSFFLNPDTAARRIAGTRELIWIDEGLAEYIADSLAYTGLPNFDVQQNGRRAGIDAKCAERLRQPAAQGLLPYLGLSGQPPGLEGAARGQLAPAFYGCGFSYVSFLVKRYPLQRVAGLRNSPDPFAALTALVGNPRRLRDEWLRSIGVTPTPP